MVGSLAGCALAGCGRARRRADSVSAAGQRRADVGRTDARGARAGRHPAPRLAPGPLPRTDRAGLLDLGRTGLARRAEAYGLPHPRRLVHLRQQRLRQPQRGPAAPGHLPRVRVNPRPTPPIHRDAERLVRDQETNQIWYSDDHYTNFREITGGC